MAQREMYDGNGPASKLVKNIATGVMSGPANEYAVTERNIIPERPFIDRSNPNQPKSQILGAIKDRVKNFFQPGDPAYNYDGIDTGAGVAPAAAPAAATPQKPPAAPIATKPPAPSAVTTTLLRTKSARKGVAGSGVMSQPDEEGLRSRSQVAAGPADAPEIAGYGEYADGTSRVYAQKADIAQPAASASVLPAPTAPRTSTIGYAHGVYEVAPGQNPPPDYASMDADQKANARFAAGMTGKQAGIANVNSEIGSRGNRDAMQAAELPSKIDLNKASARHSNVAADIGLAKAPAEIGNINSLSDLHKANTLDILNMMDPKKNNMLSETTYRNGMLRVAQDKLGILKEQIAVRLQQAKQSKNELADWKGISSSALEAIKLIDAKAALGQLSPEDAQLRQNYQDTFNTAFTRQQRSGYPQRQALADVGDE